MISLFLTAWIDAHAPSPPRHSSVTCRPRRIRYKSLDSQLIQQSSVVLPVKNSTVPPPGGRLTSLPNFTYTQSRHEWASPVGSAPDDGLPCPVLSPALPFEPALFYCWLQQLAVTVSQCRLSPSVRALVASVHLKRSDSSCCLGPVATVFVPRPSTSVAHLIKLWPWVSSVASPKRVLLST